MARTCGRAGGLSAGEQPRAGLGWIEDRAPSPSTQEGIQATCEKLIASASCLTDIGVRERVGMLARWIEKWQQADYPFRLRALRQLEAEGFSRPMLERAFDALFSAWSEKAMLELLETELGSIECLGEFLPVGASADQLAGQGGQRVSRRASPPKLTVHFLAGNVPPPAFQTLIASLLVGAPAFLKASSSSPHFSFQLVRSLVAFYPQWSDVVACACWPRSEHYLSKALLTDAEVVVAFGSDDTIEQIRRECRGPTRMIARGHRVSVIYLTREVLRRSALQELDRAVATDTALFDQEGCLSPHAVVVEEGGEVSAREFAAQLGEEALPQLKAEWPMAPLAVGYAARIMQFKGRYAFTGEVFDKGGGAAILTRDRTFELSCLGRVLLVRGVENLGEALEYLSPHRSHLQAVALGASGARRRELAEAFATFGAGRITSPGQLQSPRADWTGDGRPVLSELVRWTTLEPEPDRFSAEPPSIRKLHEPEN